MTESRTCCPCDALIHPPKPAIAAGLSSLPRQLAGFPEYRRAMLREIPIHPSLDGWRAREGDDRGVMLLEMWAYVLDILGFYDERIADESYLRTAVLRPSLRRLVELLGYRPRPALAASVVLAAIAEEHQPLALPAGTGFRSGAFDDEPPQVFESSADTCIEPKRNRWTLAPVRTLLAGNEILLEPGTSNLRKDQVALFDWSVRLPFVRGVLSVSEATLGRFSATSDGLPFVAPVPLGGASAMSDLISRALSEVAVGRRAAVELDLSGHSPPRDIRFQNMVAGKVTAVETIEGRDGETYARISIQRRPRLPRSLDLNRVKVLTPSLNAVPNGFLGSGAVTAEGESTAIVLDAVYSQLIVNSPVIVERGDEYRPARVIEAALQPVALGSEARAPQVPATRILVRPKLPGDWRSALRVHFHMVDGGRLTRVAGTHLARDDVDGAALEPPVEAPETAPPDELLLHDAEERGEKVGGSVSIDRRDPLGAGRISLNDDEEEFARPLRAPVHVFGNIVAATRGESVFNEVLGSGDASRIHQSFTLAKKPLTYLAEASAPDGSLSTLEVRVNGLLWKEVPSFFGAAAEDEVYIVRQNDDEESIVTFGDGSTGARLPSGVDNVVANYRHGAGAAKPPANSITQLARPVQGLRRVVNPVAAGGGRDADRPEEIRGNAPTSALTLGRAVSLVDFEALAYDFGVLNAHVSWAWDESCQRAVVKLWFIADGGEVAEELRSYLIGQADPNTPLQVCAATPIASLLAIDPEVDPRHDPDTVEADITAVLGDAETGLLALENIPIGCPLFRSRIFEAVLSVEGAVSVRAMTLDGRAVPVAITAPEGRYHDFLPRLKVGRGRRGATVCAAAAPARARLDLTALARPSAPTIATRVREA